MTSSLESTTLILKPDENVKIKKHSALIQISGNSIGIVQKKAFLGLIYYARAQKSVKENRTSFEIPYSQLKSLCNISSPNNNELHKQLEGLIGTVVRGNFLSKDKKKKWSAFTLLSSAREGDAGILHFDFPSQIEETLVSPEMYSLIDMGIARNITNNYALSLYELCFDYRRFGLPEMSIDDFRTLVGLSPTAYPAFKELHKFVIKKSVDEINKKTDLTVSFNLIKSGRSVTRIKFIVQANKKNIEDSSPVDDRKLSIQYLDAIKEISDGKGVAYHATLVNKVLENDTATIVAIDNYIDNKTDKIINEKALKIITSINTYLIGQNISLLHNGSKEDFCIASVNQEDSQYIISGMIGTSRESISFKKESFVNQFENILQTQGK